MFQNIIPWTLLSVRVLTPILLVGVYRWDSQVVLWMYLAAFVTDYAGGAVARRLGTATPTLRKADGVADTPFHFALVAYLVLRDWFEFKKNAFAVVVYLVTLIGWCVLDAIRWHRLAGFHSFSAKVFSIGICVWIILLLAGCATDHLLSVVLIFGTLANVEGVLISFSLSRDRADVLTLFHLKERKGTSTS